MIEASEVIFAVADVPATVAYYRDVLGFGGEWLWGDPPTFGGVRCGRVSVMFNRQLDLQPNIAGHQHFFRVGDARTLHTQHVAAGAEVLSPPENKPWGFCEYVVRDLNGYHLRFAGPVEYQRPAGATNTLPEHVAIDVTRPTLDQYLEVMRSVDWAVDRETMASVLETSLFWVLAIHRRTGEALGMLRVTGDARSYVIWDAMVRREHQGQKIGSALVEHAIAHLRRIARRGAFVGLFTGNPVFYERLGFTRSHGMHLTV